MAPEPVEALRGDDVTIRLAAAVACRAKLRVVNPQGEPVPDADVTLSLRNNHFSAPRLTGVTDESGQYESPATWPYGGYVAEIGKIGWSSAQTGIVNAVPGKTLDLGTVTTVEAAGSVSGRVVDADGKPVYWARVSGGGEGPREPVERTDDEGRFCLRELYPGSAWICAIAGNAVGATRCTVGAQDVIITLGPLATGAALRTPAAAVATTGKDADRAVARELTAEAQRRFSPDLLLGTPELLSAWVEVDPDGAAAMSQEQGQYRSQISAALALAAAVEDPEAALQHLQAIGGKALRAVAAVEAAWKASDAGSARASELAQEAVDAARDALQRHDGPIVLARAAEALWESDPAAGEATVREAQAEAEKPRDACAADGARRAAAEALCRIDLPAALAMADAISNTDTAIGCRLSIAERIAATRPADAEALVAQCLRLRREQDDAGVRYKTGVPRPDEVGPAVGRIAYAMAGVDAGRATGVARSADRPADRARALAHAALGLVGTEPQRAAALFDEALAGPLAAARALGQGPGSELANPALFAHLTCIARRIGYPDAESLCLLALACRTPSAGAAYLPELAFAEPALTATLVADVAEQPWGTQSPPDWGFRGEEQLALAAAAVDASLAADLLRSQPVDAADRQSLDRHARTWGKVMELLLTPAAERYHPVPGAVHTWAPWGRPGG